MSSILTERVLLQFEESVRVKKHSAEILAPQVARAAEIIFNSITNNGKVMACGNGGSAADCQHFAAELVGRFERERPGLFAMSLTTDTSILTALANDYAYEEIFAKQVRAIAQPGDVLVVISTSGNSPNILAAIEVAIERDVSIVALTGKGGGRMVEMLRETDILLDVPHPQTARIQEVHILLLHALCDGVDFLLLGE
jgi:D-sedoheptulose 7-phosphate isomerase